MFKERQRTTELFERQNQTIDRLLNVIKEDDGAAFLSVYEQLVAVQPRNTLYDASNDVERSRFDAEFDKFEKESVNKNATELVAAFSIAPSIQKLSVENFAGFFMEQFGAYDEFEGNIARDLLRKAEGRDIVLAIRDIQNLETEVWEKMLGWINRAQSLGEYTPNIQHPTKIRVIASAPHLQLEPKLRHLFLTVPQFDATENFDTEGTRSMMGSYRNALEELQNQSTAVIEQPHKTGKTVFRKALGVLMPGSIIEFNAASHLSRRGNLRTEELPHNTGAGIGVVDHFHLVKTKELAEQHIVEELGKSLLIVTTE